MSARKADFKRFEALGIQNLAVSANLTFSQQTFAESLKLPYPLLSDFPERKVIRAYGMLNEKTMIANRSFFLIDPQGILRRKWIIENGIRFSGMPGWKGILEDGEMWHIVRYIRHLPPKGSLGIPAVFKESEEEHQHMESGHDRPDHH